MTQATTRHVVIIGGGASGALLAYQLLKDPTPRFRVTIVERRHEIGRGLAYNTGNPDHLLNVRVANMSALPDDPDHFWRWLSARETGDPFCPDRYCFVPRRLFGDYIASLIGQVSSRHLEIVRGECVAVTEHADGVTITLADGTRHVADCAVLATGHDPTRITSRLQVDPWAGGLSDLDKDATVLILGTGLTMADYVLSMLREGHRGSIVAISRRGLLSRAHRRTDTLLIHEADIPFGCAAAPLLRWLRSRIASHVRAGGDWRSVIDAIRPYTQRVWQELPISSRRSFLEHARAWWDVHRHRAAPEVDARIAQARSEGRLRILAAKITAIEPAGSSARVRYRSRGSAEVAEMDVGAIVDCTGVVRDPGATTNPAIRSLFDQGQARADPLRIGIDVAPDCAIIDHRGVPSSRLFAVGPLTRAAFWEIIAIPDIRSQCAKLADRLIAE